MHPSGNSPAAPSPDGLKDSHQNNRFFIVKGAAVPAAIASLKTLSINVFVVHGQVLMFVSLFDEADVKMLVVLVGPLGKFCAANSFPNPRGYRWLR